MRVAQLLTRVPVLDESVGANMIAYIDFADQYLEHADRQLFDPLAAFLLKHGFVFKTPEDGVHPSGIPRFVNQETDFRAAVLLPSRSSFLTKHGDRQVVITKVHFNRPFGARNNSTKIIDIQALAADGALIISEADLKRLVSNNAPA